MMKKILDNTWSELQDHQRASIQMSALFTPVAYVVILLYYDNFIDTDIWNRIICSLGATIFAAFICTAILSLFNTPSDRYGSMIALIFILTTIGSVLPAMVGAINSILLGVSLFSSWYPLLVFFTFTFILLMALHRDEKKKKKDEQENAE